MRIKRCATTDGATAIAVAAVAACGDGAPAARSSAVVTDSAGIEIVTNDPWTTEAHCAIGDEPILSIGAREGDAPHISASRARHGNFRCQQRRRRTCSGI